MHKEAKSKRNQRHRPDGQVIEDKKVKVTIFARYVADKKTLSLQLDSAIDHASL